jgi:SAM-dependent methyltransferase
MINPKDVVNAYRLILGREPESDELVNRYATEISDLNALRDLFLSSSEFRHHFEHVYAPRKYAKTIFDLLLPGGTAIISTPYHGYFKNLAMALSGKMDDHFHALWDHGHIKFWSKKTIKSLLLEAGFVDINFKLVGRIPILAKSMIVIARKP